MDPMVRTYSQNSAHIATRWSSIFFCLLTEVKPANTSLELHQFVGSNFCSAVCAKSKVFAGV